MVMVPANLTFDRIELDPEGAGEMRGGMSMTKAIRTPGDPPFQQTLKSSINSIVAAAKTARDLESAFRKATRNKDQNSLTVPK